MFCLAHSISFPASTAMLRAVKNAVHEPQIFTINTVLHFAAVIALNSNFLPNAASTQYCTVLLSVWILQLNSNWLEQYSALLYSTAQSCAQCEWWLTLLISTSSLRVIIVNNWLCLSVCLSVCHKLQIASSFLFLNGIQSLFGRQFSMTPSTKLFSSIFDSGPLTPKIYSPKFAQNRL